MNSLEKELKALIDQYDAMAESVTSERERIADILCQKHSKLEKIQHWLGKASIYAVVGIIISVAMHVFCIISEAASTPALLNIFDITVVIAVSVVIYGTILLLRYPLLHIYTDDPAVIASASIRSSVIAPTYFLCGMMDTMVGLLRGMGSSVTPMIVSIAGVCVLRVIWILAIFPLAPTLTMLYASYPISWAITFAAHFVCYLRVKKRKYGV